MEPVRRKNRFWLIASVLILAGGGIYGAYLYQSYRSMEQVFLAPLESVPTRIFSDVVRIGKPQNRSWIEKRLSTLRYQFESQPTSISFRLRELDYPVALLPENHPTPSLQGQTLYLEFESNAKDAPLIGIQAGSAVVIDEVYLEPQIVATLSRSSKSIREVLKFHEVPSSIWKAIIAVEDQHFLDHQGFDPRGLARAVLVNLKSLSFKQGGSTITQQLVKNLTARTDKNLFKKVNELFLSLLLEINYEKELILERYLNEVYLGQIGTLEVHGVAEGAKYFFGKRLQTLNLAEIALLAGLIRGPGYYSPYRHLDRAMERQRVVLAKMVETGQIARAQADDAQNERIRLVPPPRRLNQAPYFVDYAKARLTEELSFRFDEQQISGAGLRVYTTLDPFLNTRAQEAVGKQVKALEERYSLEAGVLEGALAAVDQQTGFLKALIGGRSYRASTFNRILNMKRQVGSTFKPLVYLTAFTDGEDKDGIPLGPGYPMRDEKFTYTFDEGRQSWSPKNYSKEFRGWIPIAEGLVFSINTIAAQLGISIGIEKVVETARAFGIESELPSVPSLALGVAELSPVELLGVYGTLAARGIRRNLTVLRIVTQDSGEVLYTAPAEVAKVWPSGPIDSLVEVMKDIFERGTARASSAMGWYRPSAGKTGTTSGYRDAWFAGFTPQLTAVTWVGYDKGGAGEGSKGRLTGAGAALPVWVDFMKSAHAVLPTVDFERSEVLEPIEIDLKSGAQAKRSCPEEQTAVYLYWTERAPDKRACFDDYEKHRIFDAPQ
jgi:penicillin-binding protein 1B